MKERKKRRRVGKTGKPYTGQTETALRRKRGEGSAGWNDSVSGIRKGSRLKQQIIAMMFQFPEILQEIKKHDVLNNFTDEVLKYMGRAIMEK